MKPSPKHVLGAIAGGLACMFVATAHADPAAVSSGARFPVVVVVPRCVKAPLPDLQRIIGAELGVEVAAQVEEEPPVPESATVDPRAAISDDPDVTRITIACTRHLIRLDVLDPVSGKTLVRHLDLSGSDPSTRTRLLALSAAELVAASWIELTARPAARSQIVEAKASPGARDTAVNAARKALAPPSFYRIDAIASAQRSGSTDLLTLGGGIGGSWVHGGWQVVGGDLRLESGSADVSLGTIRTMLVSASGSLRIRKRLGWVAVEGGLGVRGGLAYMRGIPAEITPRPDATSATLPWWGPMIMLRVEASIAERVAFVMGLEAGRVIYAAGGRSGGRTELAIENQWVGVTLGPALTLGGAP